MKIEIDINIGTYTEQEATVRIASFCRSQINRIRAQQKVATIPELDESPEKATQFVTEFLTASMLDALKSGAQIYNSVKGKLAGKDEFEKKFEALKNK